MSDDDEDEEDQGSEEEADMSDGEANQAQRLTGQAAKGSTAASQQVAPQSLRSKDSAVVLGIAKTHALSTTPHLYIRLPCWAIQEAMCSAQLWGLDVSVYDAVATHICQAPNRRCCM